MPKAIVVGNDGRGRGRSGKSAKRSERGWFMRLALRSPKDTVAMTLAGVAVVAILVNALFLQAGRHPSPLFGASIALPAGPVTTNVTPDAAAASPSPLPRSRPAEAESQSTESIKVSTGAAAASASAAHGSQGRTVAPAATVRNDPLANLIISSQRVAAVQRALTDYGYGQIKPTGTVNSDTQAAIQKFERERKLPITGQVSERLVHELGAATGRTIE